MKRVWIPCFLAGASLAAVLAIAASPLVNPSSPPNKIAKTSDDLIVHEWGTFTTFSGSDGIHLDFRPLAAAHSDLPGFVHDRMTGHPGLWLTKSRLYAKVRMETPVTYFYTDKERTIRASVEFPKGMLTEFYPPVREFAPPLDYKLAMTTGELIGNSRLDWGEIRLIPPSAFLPSVADSEDAQWLQQQFINRICLPGDGHYTAARETDSAFVLASAPKIDQATPAGGLPQVNQAVLLADDPAWPPASALPNGTWGGWNGRAVEKFLFYRGVGKFDLPVKAEVGSDDTITVRNAGPHDLTRMFLVQKSGDMLLTATVDGVGRGQSVIFPRPTQIGKDDFAQSVVRSLTEQGLYPKEAAAMVKTWNDSWFDEEGTRVFYCVPQTVTDELLPLKIEPKPAQSVRVLVARLEIMPVSEERRLTKVVEESAANRARLIKEWQEANANKEKVEPFQHPPMPQELVNLGRLAEPALARVRALAKTDDVRQEADGLLRQLRPL
jgi:hypothetical protein